MEIYKNKEKGNDVSYAEMNNPHLDSEDHYWIKVPFEGDIFTKGNDGLELKKKNVKMINMKYLQVQILKIEYVKIYQIAKDEEKFSRDDKKCMPTGEFFIKVNLDNNLFDELTINDVLKIFTKTTNYSI